MYILGLKVHGHDTGAALISDADGQLEIIAIAEARLNRRKHSYTYPLLAIQYCMDHFGLDNFDAVDYIFIDRHTGFVVTEPSQWGVEGAVSGRGNGSDENYRDSYLIEQSISFNQSRCRYVDHTDAHAASSFFVSGFDQAAVLVVEGGLGIYRGSGCSLEVIDRMGYGNAEFHGRRMIKPEGSIILNTSHFFDVVTNRLGFSAFDAGKTMGLAAYGHTVPAVDYIRLTGQRYQNAVPFYASAIRKTHHLLPQRQDWENPLSEYWINVAREAQSYLEEDMLHLTRYAYKEVGGSNLCLAGGVALSCITNRRIYDETPFKNIFVQPAASDEGIALGCALWGYYHVAGGRTRTRMDNAYLGRTYDSKVVPNLLSRWGVDCLPATNRDLAAAIASGQIVGRMSGKSEFGPRSLGNRSILADPREPDMMAIINQRIKHRESFRPFAPSCHEDKRERYFDLPMISPFMIMTGQAKAETRIPAVVHVDGSCRVQTVSIEQNQDYYDLIEQFGQLTDVYVLLNTSFNDNGEAIVETYEDALLSFVRTGLDALWLDGYLVKRPKDATKLADRLSHSITDAITERYQIGVARFCDVVQRMIVTERVDSATRTFSRHAPERRRRLAEGVKMILFPIREAVRSARTKAIRLTSPASFRINSKKL